MSVGDAIAWAIDAASTGMRADMVGIGITAQMVWWLFGPAIREALGWD